jgi:transcriptional repressor NF-X1
MTNSEKSKNLESKESPSSNQKKKKNESKSGLVIQKTYTSGRAESSLVEISNSSSSTSQQSNIPVNQKQNTSKSSIKKKKNQTSSKDKPLPEPLDINLRESLILKLNNQSIECMICFDNVKVRQKIWDCKTCFNIFHFQVLF